MSEQDDVFASPIVDFEVLEAAKENVQPLASGRRVTAVAAVFSTPHAQREAQLKAARTLHQRDVQAALESEDDEDDPLEAYCRFVYWTVENYPQGHSAESGLLELLEEATRVLKDNRGGVWRSDLKYLKLWVLYATYVEKPVTIYKFLLANDIGTDHALLYEEYADALERNGRRTAADEAYLLGIARHAFPTERLQARHREFQKRMMSSAPLPTPAPVAASTAAATRRAVLGTTSSSTPPPSSSSSQGARSPPSATPSPSIPQSNSRLQIFVDPLGAEAQDAESSATPWADIGTRKTRVKENVPEVKKLGGTTLRQAGRAKRVASGSGGASRIVPFRDPEPGDGDVMPPPPVPKKSTVVPFRDEPAPEPPATPKFTPFRDEVPGSPTTPSRSTSPGTVMRLKAGSRGLALASEAEALRKDPFKNYGESERPVDDGLE
ncbi:hypothetical protein PLICRDRAFT_125133 [Plicaturopsis crispa FD-325 SS-3]|nr:hypothetical protein PLICRDRAFT_125133 [Plicaturopsis crispa FD-325 SS-3]